MEPMKLAVAKGRIAEKARALLSEGGIAFPDTLYDERKLVITSIDGSFQLLFVKAADVPTYVEKGAADIGIVGKDTIMEDGKDVYELQDLGFGKCQLVVAGFPGSFPDDAKYLTVATKYPAITKEYFDKAGIRTDISRLNGSIELAPIVGLSEVIVDIVETGSTLRDNGLVVLKEIAKVSTRVIANKASYATRTEEVQTCIELLKKGVKERREDSYQT
ncbi:ATP phosphoribosyltransferase [Sporosarcina aquimarina]|uniref:ATP phosphoribosyltransferase n=1 Tax=Sporosarcina aquimarina TaxID=114975 RepID=A0ABU4FZY1_9BACL|nr:ATP phosphoribosyltransferase [Sporosarcina aquimarina]MDW0110266.1 ATP phosphoribosyltransferase [Sporosarcina aquimarina]